MSYLEKIDIEKYRVEPTTTYTIKTYLPIIQPLFDTNISKTLTKTIFIKSADIQKYLEKIFNDKDLGISVDFITDVLFVKSLSLFLLDSNFTFRDIDSYFNLNEIKLKEIMKKLVIVSEKFSFEESITFNALISAMCSGNSSRIGQISYLLDIIPDHIFEQNINLLLEQSPHIDTGKDKLYARLKQISDDIVSMFEAVLV